MIIIRALRIVTDSIIAFVGAGGKTTSMFQLARQFENGAVVSTTTKLGFEQAVLADEHLVWNDNICIEVQNFGQRKVQLVTAGAGKTSIHLLGLNYERISTLKDLCNSHQKPLLIEADGARTAAFKAPAEYEPVIPDWVQHVVVVAGLSALGQPISLPWIFRPERVAQLAGVEEDSKLTLEKMCQVLGHPQGGLKGIPPSARTTLLLNQADVHPLQPNEERYLNEYLFGIYDQLVVGSAWSEDSFRVLF